MTFINENSWLTNPLSWASNDELDLSFPLRYIALMALILQEDYKSNPTEFLKIHSRQFKRSPLFEILIEMFYFETSLDYIEHKLSKAFNNQQKAQLIDRFMPDLYLKMLKARSLVSFRQLEIVELARGVRLSSRSLHTRALASRMLSHLGVSLTDSSNNSKALRASKDNHKIASICVVRNEERKIERHIDQLENIVDHFIYYLDNCTDQTEDIVRSKIQPAKLTIIKATEQQYRDSNAYIKCFEIARVNNCKVIIKIDPDEEFESNAYLQRISTLARSMRPNLVLSVPWLQSDGREYLWDSTFSNLPLATFMPFNFKEVLYVDDGISKHADIPFHCPWIPACDINKDLFIQAKDGESDYLLHRDKCSKGEIYNFIIKTDAYTLKDFTNFDTRRGILFKRYGPKMSQVLRNFSVSGLDIIYFKDLISDELQRDESWTKYIQKLIAVDRRNQDVMFYDYSKLFQEISQAL